MARAEERRAMREHRESMTQKEAEQRIADRVALAVYREGLYFCPRSELERRLGPRFQQLPKSSRDDIMIRLVLALQKNRQWSPRQLPLHQRFTVSFTYTRTALHDAREALEQSVRLSQPIDEQRKILEKVLWQNFLMARPEKLCEGGCLHKIHQRLSNQELKKQESQRASCPGLRRPTVALLDKSRTKLIYYS
uniref:Uncharacterized protein n=1 Tax=Steinernema glaseri TaxID=37863 RepID=A0A1I7ZJF7_9BILA